MGWCCCNRICSVGNCARLLHLSLTLFVFYVLLITPSSELHHAWQHKTSKFFTVIALVVLSTLCFLTASLTDPGFEPLLRDTPALLTNHNKYMPKEGGAYDSSDSERPTDCDTVSGQWTCRSCNIVVRLRSRHCKLCQRCVRKFDHHCPWLGNCVGERNHRFFWLFLGLEMVLLTWGIIVSWNALLASNSLVTWVRTNILVFSSLVVVFFGCIASTILFFFHTYLMMSGQTTWEMASRLKISYLRDLDPPINPFDEGSCRNVFRFLCVFGPNNWDLVYNRAVDKMGPTV